MTKGSGTSSELSDARGRTLIIVDFNAASRFALKCFGPAAVCSYWLGHSLSSLGDQLARVGIASAFLGILFDRRGVLVILICAFAFALSHFIVRRAEALAARLHGEALATLGPHSVGQGILITAPIALAAILVTLLDPTLLNTWDQVFLWLALSIQYIGASAYFYCGVPLAEWASSDPQVELKQLELVWDAQKMLLRAFAAIIFTVLIGQVLGVMQLKYGGMWKDPVAWQRSTPHILINAGQVAFIVLGWWALIVSLILRRMESVQLRLRKLVLRGSA